MDIERWRGRRGENEGLAKAIAGEAKKLTRRWEGCQKENKFHNRS